MNTFTKLRNGDWGTRCTEDVAVDDKVRITKKSGVSVTKAITAVLWRGADGVSLCSIGDVSAPAATPKAPAAQRKAPRGWRECGYPGCHPQYCDECEGHGANSRAY